MKKALLFTITILLSVSLVACGNKAVKPDYSTDNKFEQVLNAGKNLQGKTVKVVVDRVIPDSDFGFDLKAGKHLNFVSEYNPNAEKGDELILKVKRVSYVSGSFIITYIKLAKLTGTP